MPRILSIDFDYFLDTDVETRNNKFPDGVELKSEKEIKEDWEEACSVYPEIKNIGVISDYFYLLDNLPHVSDKCLFLCSDSHKDISQFFHFVVPNEEKIEVVNIDFHHDTYISGGTKIDCANWLRHLTELRPDTEVLWIAREDSETVSMLGDFPYPISFKIEDIGSEPYDFIFLCFSPEWTPLHLKNNYYKHLFNNLVNLIPERKDE